MIKMNFIKKIPGHYLDCYADSTYVALEQERCQGYITICPNTKEDAFLWQQHPWLLDFRECYQRFPAHLHINMAASARGKGLELFTD